MTKKIIITVLSILLFAGVVVGGYFGYKKLSEINPPDTGTLGTGQKGDYKDFTVTDVNGKEVKLSDFIGKPIVINFWASWCGPCKALMPTIEEIAIEYAEKIKVVKIDVDRNENLAVKYGIMSIPALLFFVNGKPEKSLIGVQSKEKIEKTIRKFL